MCKFVEKFNTLSGLIERIAEVDEALMGYEQQTALLGAQDTQTATATAATISSDLGERGGGGGAGADSSLQQQLPAIQLSGCDIVTPTGICLARQIELEITPERPLMVPYCAKYKSLGLAQN